MKYLPVVLSTALLLLMSCSEGQNPINLGDPTAETAEIDAAEPATLDDSEEPPEADTEADDDSESKDSGDDKEDTEGVDQKNVKLEVDSQKTAGQVIVKKVATSRDGWVSIHNSREDGSIVLPESIGEARVDSGDSENIIVDLWEAPYVGDKLWVLLHIDAGERGRYEFPSKDLAVRKNGETMARSFIIKGEEKEAEEE
ncbi:MAG: hypothetical protein AAFP03_13345 [Cyanobacteria bacterium J06598_3]